MGCIPGTAELGLNTRLKGSFVVIDQLYVFIIALESILVRGEFINCLEDVLLKMVLCK